MTKLEAIEMSIQIWKWLSETENSDQGKWKAVRELGLPIDMLFNCPACFYTIQSSNCQDCNKCPIWEMDEDGRPYQCLRAEYGPWENSENSLYQRRNAAESVLKKCIQAWEKETGEAFVHL